MVRPRVIVLVLLLCLNVALPLGAAEEGSPPSLVLEEVVTDPQTDWDQSGAVTSSDEYVVLRNIGDVTIALEGWQLLMDDTTPATEDLQGSLAPGEAHVLLNPTGVMNNDVHLVLRDANGVVDEAALGSGGSPDGNAATQLDEAVYLDGHWSGVRAPAAYGAGLPAVWVEAVAESRQPLVPLEIPWIGSGERTLDLRLHTAPHWQGVPRLQVDANEVALEAQGDAVWRADPIASGPPVATLSVLADEAISTFPDGTPLVLPVDAAPPYLTEQEDAVVNATRHLHWLPSVADDESGLVALDVATRVASGETRPLASCADPRFGTPTCALDDNVSALVLQAVDRVGNNATFSIAMTNDTTAPSMPASFVFEPQTPPHLSWSAASEPLLGLVIEAADDVGGTWNRTRIALPADGRTFIDEAWTPGAPRAYRLVGTDRAGNENRTAWIPLPPEAVPVQANSTDVDVALARLINGSSAAVTVAFDRPMATLPRLVLHTQHPEPYRLAVPGTATPDHRAAHYALSPEGDLPRTGTGTWRLEGGRGEDAAPVSPFLAPADWDVEPPRIVVAGLSADWLALPRHVVVVSAFDRGSGPAPVEVAAEGATVRARDPGTVEVAFHEEGIYALEARASDAGGRVAERMATLRLDATPPDLRLEEVPEQWSDETPIVVLARDALSGIDAASFAAALATASGTHEPAVRWNGASVELRPQDGPVSGPFALELVVQDLAGNRATGMLGEPVTRSRMAVSVTVNETLPEATPGPDAGHDAPTTDGAQSAPTASGPVTAWTDLGLPPPNASAAAASDGGDPDHTPLVAGVVSAGLLGLGTVVHRQRQGRKKEKIQEKGTQSRRSLAAVARVGGGDEEGA